ncbi:MAG: DUF6794 domain-containing protein [Myxococcaceae bacterium]
MNAPLAILLSVLGGWKAYTADVTLPVPKGWRFDPNVMQPSPTVRARDGSCSNDIWFDFIPGATVDFAKQLIATESIEVTAAIHRWDVQTYADVVLAKHAAVVFRVEERSVYVIPSEAGALVVQAMASGRKPEACLPLHDDVASTLVALFFAPAVQESVRRIAKTGKPPPVRQLEPVPNDLPEALELLTKLCDAETLAQLRASKEETDMYRLHHGLGMGLRNRWGLWGGSPLAKRFQAMGVFHPDDMSSIVLRSFWRKLHDRPIELEAQAAAARRYWDLREPPDAAQACTGAKALFGLEAPERFVHVYSCGRGAYQAYELDAGWYVPDPKLKKRIEVLRREGDLISAPLEEPSRH